jgi:saccharopine dehydrogenase (NAD+, L-lysine-forming)
VLTVYGATGYTGRLIAELLLARGVHFTMAGRSAEKLHHLRDELARRGTAPDLAVVSLSDRTGLEALAKRSRVILSCAGPFAEMGPPIVDACLRGGAHYLDITGEARFMVATALRDREAKEAKVALVNAVGFDVVPSDLCAFLASRALGPGGPPEQVDLALATGGAKPSGGTMRSIAGILKDSGLRFENGSWIEEPIAREKRRFDFPELGSREAFNAPIGDVATAPRTTGAQRVRVWAKLPPIFARVVSIGLPFARPLLKTPLAKLAENAIPPAGEGPSEGERRSSRFSIVAEARRGGTLAQATISGRDGYGLTAETAVCIATAMLDARYDKTGALSPMQALDPSVWRGLLERLGCNINV